MADAPLIRRLSPEGEVKSGRNPLATPQAVLSFWFGCPEDPDYNQNRALWWEADAHFDAAIRRHFLPTWQAASKGKLDHWATDAEGALALVIVLDQFSRNLQRQSPRTWQNDPAALRWARFALGHGWDQALPMLQRAFFYLPFEHAENADDQAQAVALFTPYQHAPGLTIFYEAAQTHQQVVARFGRFPHRNAVLGRASTAAELEFLAETPRGY